MSMDYAEAAYVANEVIDAEFSNIRYGGTPEIHTSPVYGGEKKIHIIGSMYVNGRAENLVNPYNLSTIKEAPIKGVRYIFKHDSMPEGPFDGDIIVDIPAEDYRKYYRRPFVRSMGEYDKLYYAILPYSANGVYNLESLGVERSIMANEFRWGVYIDYSKTGKNVNSEGDRNIALSNTELRLDTEDFYPPTAYSDLHTVRYVLEQWENNLWLKRVRFYVVDTNTGKAKYEIDDRGCIPGTNEKPDIKYTKGDGSNQYGLYVWIPKFYITNEETEAEDDHAYQVFHYPTDGHKEDNWINPGFYDQNGNETEGLFYPMYATSAYGLNGYESIPNNSNWASDTFNNINSVTDANSSFKYSKKIFFVGGPVMDCLAIMACGIFETLDLGSVIGDGFVYNGDDNTAYRSNKDWQGYHPLFRYGPSGSGPNSVPSLFFGMSATLGWAGEMVDPYYTINKNTGVMAYRKEPVGGYSSKNWMFTGHINSSYKLKNTSGQGWTYPSKFAKLDPNMPVLIADLNSRGGSTNNGLFDGFGIQNITGSGTHDTLMTPVRYGRRTFGAQGGIFTQWWTTRDFRSNSEYGPTFSQNHNQGFSHMECGVIPPVGYDPLTELGDYDVY